MKRLHFFALLTALSASLQTVIAQVSKNIHVSVPGTLTSLLTAEEKSSITDLSVTGVIDARDFRTIRDNISNIQTLNISTVNIAEYSGYDEGIGDNILNPANAIPAYALLGSYLESVILPQSITSIEIGAFNACYGLKSISIPAGVKTIGEWAFSSCNSLQTMVIPASVTYIGPYAFSSCRNLSSVTNHSSITSIKSGLFYECSALTSFNIPETVTIIKEEAFYGCSSLTSMVIPPSVSTIEKKTFDGCYSLNSINIPWGITTINDKIFSSCYRLKSIDIPSSVTHIGSGAFEICTSLENINLPSSVTYIGGGAFRDCSNLKKIKLPATITAIDEGAFQGCNSLKTIGLPPLITKLEDGIFSGCSSLESINIPASVISIGTSAFMGCKNLTSIVIPSAVNRIGGVAFRDCINLKSVYVNSKTPASLGVYFYKAFYGVDLNLCVLYVPQGSLVDYQNADYWKEFGNIREIQNIQIPFIRLSQSVLHYGDILKINGFNFTSPGEVTLSCYTASIISDTISTEAGGNFSYEIPITENMKTGDYTLYTEDIASGQIPSPLQFKIEGLAQPKNYLKILSPGNENLKTFAGEPLDINWEDYIAFDKRYQIFDEKAERFYSYFVELESLIGEGGVVSDTLLEGSALLNQKISFQHTFFPRQTGQYLIRIWDKTTQKAVESPLFTVIAPPQHVILGKEWDCSVLRADGSFHRPENLPKGVAADGTSRIYLTVTAKDKTIEKISISLSDQEGQHTTAELLGKVMPATVTDTYSDEANNAQSTSTEHLQCGLSKYYFWYVAPDDFSGSNASGVNKSVRIVDANIHITYADQTTATEKIQIEVVRPAVMMVHGLGSSGSKCWGKFSLDGKTPLTEDARFKYVAAIDVYPDMDFFVNARGLLGESPRFAESTFDYFNKKMRLEGYASNRVDYICHSMGGCILRYATEHYAEEFYCSQNYGKGYTNKVITINTPHEGSPLGDALKLIVESVFNEYVNLELNVAPMILDINEVYDQLRDDLEDAPFNICHYMRPSLIEQHSLQKLANWGSGLFGTNWQLPVVRKFTITPAVRDLSIKEGTRFYQPSNVEGHMIAGDIIAGVQDFWTFDTFSSHTFDDLFKKSKNFKKMVKYFENVLEVMSFLKAEDQDNIFGLNGFDFSYLEEDYKEIMKIADENLRLFAAFDNMIKRINIVITGVNTIGFLVDSDVVVPLKSQLAGSTQGLLHNHTVFNDMDWLHMTIVNKPYVSKRVEELMQTSVKSPLFGPIPASIQKPSPLKSNVTQPVISFKKLRSDVNSEKIELTNLTGSTVLKPADLLSIKLSIKDLEKLKYVEISFQGEDYRRYDIAGDIVLNLSVNNAYLNSQPIVAKAFYDYGDSIYTAYAGMLVDVFPDQDPIRFSCKNKIFRCAAGDVLRPSYEAVYPTFIYSFGKNNQLKATNLGANIVSFDPDDCAFICTSDGTTYMELDYMGQKDTVYFIVEKKQAGDNVGIKFAEPDKKGDTNFISVYPNPVRDRLNIEFQSTLIDPVSIRLINMMGQTVQQWSFFAENPQSIDIQSCLPGIYILEILTEKGKIQKKIVKK